jgi:two-component sensor histidine kinase
MINKITTHPPIPYFQSILINDKESDLSGQVLLLRNNNKITFNFSCINYSSTPILYSYRLAGLDTAWTSGTSRNVVYQNLNPGNYMFLLRVRKPNAEWSNPVTWKINVKVVFWQHPLFYIALFMICAGLFFLYFLMRKNNQIKRRELDSQLITLEQKALQSMMNPHFIFNSLGSIQNYLLQKKSGEAGLYLSQFARLIRQNLNAINAANINLEEEIDRLKNYLDLEKLRMDNKFDYIIDLDETLEADEILIPSMIIQPFVENAIWHGISPIEEKGVITIKFRKMDEKSLKIIIKDNGVGMKKSRSFSTESEKHIHMGIEMTRRRLELLGKKYSIDTSIECCEVSPGLPNPGTRIVLVVPVSYSDAEV